MLIGRAFPEEAHAAPPDAGPLSGAMARHLCPRPLARFFSVPLSVHQPQADRALRAVLASLQAA